MGQIDFLINRFQFLAQCEFVIKSQYDLFLLSFEKYKTSGDVDINTVNKINEYINIIIPKLKN